MGKVLFIDYDGTLHDSDAKYDTKLDGLFGMNGLRLWETYLSLHREVVHTQYPQRHDDFMFHQRLLFEHLGVPYDDGEASRIARLFQEAQEECWTNPTFFPDSLPFLDRAVERHVLCLATGDYAPQKAEALGRAGGRSYFQYAFDRDHLGLKGGSAYFENALARTDCRPEEAVALGDSYEHDIVAAKSAGITTVWLDRNGKSGGRLPPEADYLVKNLMEALAYI